MPEKKLLSMDLTDQERLREQIQIFQEELEKIEREVSAFEAVLYARISDLIVEEQELFVLYKQIKKAKKANRLEQKKRGKNYKEPKGLQVVLEEKKKRSSIRTTAGKEKVIPRSFIACASR